MDCIILAGGFARRLLPLTENTPKPLLPVGGRPILSYLVEKLRRVKGLGKCYLTTNRRFAGHFRDFVSRETAGLEVELFVEDAEHEGQKLGSVGALHCLAGKVRLAGDCLVLGGDNLFDFELADLAACQRKLGASMVALYDVRTKERASLYGVVEMGRDGRIRALLEKPRRPPSTLASTACYLFTGEAMRSLRTYIDEGNHPDAAGHFVAWLCRRLPVHGYVFTGMWFDIGSKESYEEANRLFWERRKGKEGPGKAGPGKPGSRP